MSLDDPRSRSPSSTDPVDGEYIAVPVDRDGERSLPGRIAGALAKLTFRTGGQVASRLGLDDAARAAVDRTLAGPLAEQLAAELAEQGVIERVTRQLIEDGVPEQVVDQVLASELPEELIDRVLTRDVAERVVERVLTSPGVEPAAAKVIESDLVDQLTRRILDSDEMEMAIERVAASPQVRNAVARQGVGLIDDVGDKLSLIAARLDGAVERLPRFLLRRRRRAEPPPQAGVVSRVLALAVDALILNALAFAGSAALALAVSMLGGGDRFPNEAVVAGGAVWSLGAAVYLATFWTLAGQTPGMRFLNLRLVKLDGTDIRLRDSIRRLVGMVLAALPLFLGYALVLVNDRRRGLHDRIAHTEVLYEQDEWGPAKGPSASSSASTT
jgi:uncharacterized RDD family membrane protein YckC